MIKSRIPNLLTITRIVLSVLLIFIKPLSWIFVVVYISAGISDILDGFLARRFKCTSQRGALLNSIADAIFFVVVIYKIFPLLYINRIIVFFILVIFVMKIISLIVAYIKFHKFGFIHTYMNKLAGFVIFCVPLIIIISVKSSILLLLCIVAFLAATEELYINIKFNEYKSNRKSFKHS